MKEIPKNLGEVLSMSNQERLDFAYDFFTAPITYARELKEAVTRKVGGGLRGEVAGIVAAAAPIIIPLIFPISAISRGGNVGAGVLGGLLFWTISSAAVYVLKSEGAIGTKKK